jgi:outer membrane protein OmpA-like peptidoglycan-associated protein
MDAVKGYLTPDLVRNASTLVGESESSTRQTLNGTVPCILSGLTSMVSSREGAGAFAGMLRDPSFGQVVDNASTLFSGGRATENVLNAGTSMMGKIFGNRSSSVTEAVSKYGGVSASAGTSLLGLVAPLIMGVLGKRASAQGLDSSGMVNALLSEKGDISAAVPPGIAQMLRPGPTIAPRLREAETPRYARPGEAYTEKKRSWMPLLLIGLGLLALLVMFMRGRSPRTTVGDVTSKAKGSLANLSLPGGVNLSVPDGSLNYNLARFLGDSSAAAPRNFVFDNLNFETGSTQLTQPSTKTVNDLAQVLKAYPNAQVELVGHTDNSGSPEANQQLSQARADTVRAMLVSDGVAGDRIATQGYGQDRPMASNDTDEGRAQNRRIELNVTKK